jgi:hypothetical protein
MWIDMIVEETRKTREEHAARFNYDLKAIYEDLKQQEQQGGREIVSLSPKGPAQTVGEMRGSFC